MIATEELQEYRELCARRKSAREYMRAYTNDPAHPERLWKNRAHAHRGYHKKRGKRPSEIYYDPLAAKIKRLNDGARRRTPEFRAKRRERLAVKRRADWDAIINGGDLSVVQKRMWRAAKNRAAKFGLAFTISPADIIIPSVCPVLGIALKFDNHSFSASSPSLDQIVPRGGYTPENIVVVSRRANVLKNDATLEEMEKLVAFYRPLMGK